MRNSPGAVNFSELVQVDLPESLIFAHGSFRPTSMSAPPVVPAAKIPSDAQAPAGRLASIDGYRGFVMFLLMAEVLHLEQVARAHPNSGWLHFLAVNQEHADWVGCTLHDLIQPSFSFLVGVALTFSVAGRLARGQSRLHAHLHAWWRAILMILLGVFLRSTSSTQTYWTFEDTVTQIGLGYPFLFLLALRSRRTQWIAFVVILVGYWAAWAAYPIPNSFTTTSIANAPAWTHDAHGFAAHWNKHANLGVAFDQWFLNLFPRAQPFVANPGGYLTLSFIPTLGTMILGLLAGGWLRDDRSPRQRVNRLVVVGLVLIAIGLLLHGLGICPLVKRIWTPTWTLFSGGWCLLLLAAFYGVIDAKGWQRWAFPLRVIGLNSITAYVLSWLMYDPVKRALDIHLGTETFSFFGPDAAPFVRGLLILAIYWLFLFWMYRRRLFLKI